MIQLQDHKGTTHNFKEAWTDFTLAEAMQLRAIELPDLTEDGDWFEHIEKVLDVLKLFTTVDFIGSGSPTYAVHWFKKYALPLWIDLRSDLPKSYTPRLIESFQHEGKTYLMPDHLAIGDEVILQHEQAAKRFMEASNLLSAYTKMTIEGIKAMPLFIAAVVVEKRDEEWSEKTVAERAATFHTLPMTTVWEVFFCTQRLWYKAARNILASMLEMDAARKRKGTVGQRLRSVIGDLQLHRAELREELKQLKG
jgi:hypothetical protein